VSISPPSKRGGGYEYPDQTEFACVHYVVFDLETVFDLAIARRLLGLDAAVPDDAVREAIADWNGAFGLGALGTSSGSLA
jgi:hypothetical protein